MKKDWISILYNLVAEITVERVKKEKATKLSRRTLKMIALTQSLFNSSRI